MSESYNLVFPSFFENRENYCAHKKYFQTKIILPGLSVKMVYFIFFLSRNIVNGESEITLQITILQYQPEREKKVLSIFYSSGFTNRKCINFMSSQFAASIEFHP